MISFNSFILYVKLFPKSLWKYVSDDTFLVVREFLVNFVFMYAAYKLAIGHVSIYKFAIFWIILDSVKGLTEKILSKMIEFGKLKQNKIESVYLWILVFFTILFEFITYLYRGRI